MRWRGEEGEGRNSGRMRGGGWKKPVVEEEGVGGGVYVGEGGMVSWLFSLW